MLSGAKHLRFRSTQRPFATQKLAQSKRLQVSFFMHTAAPQYRCLRVTDRHPQCGHTLHKFLDDFPSVPSALAIAALEQAMQHLIADANQQKPRKFGV